MLRRLREEDWLGKPGIKNVDVTAINSVKIFFTDNSFIELFAETAIATSAGEIPGIFIEDYDNDISKKI